MKKSLKIILIICLIIESALVLFGLLMGWNVWVGIVCYWVVLLMKNINDYLDARRKTRDQE